MSAAATKRVRPMLAGLALAALAGCASVPPGPRAAVMPAPGKPFEQFSAEERHCRHQAERAADGSALRAADQDAFASAAVGTAIGALAGAAIGGRDAAAAGAAFGLIAGSAAGAGRSGVAARDAQRRYDIAYQQCMYASGNSLPAGYGARPRALPYAGPGWRGAAPAAYPPPPPSPPY